MRIGNQKARTALAAVAMVMPGKVRRGIHTRLLGHDTHPEAHIGHSFVDVDRLSMGARATIGHLNVIRGLEELSMADAAIIVHLNWINAVRRDKGFFDGVDRRLALIMHYNARIMLMHFVDCCAVVEMGERASVAGYWSLIMTHSFDHRTNRQGAIPIYIGDNTLVATRCTLLPGTAIAETSIVAAGSMVTGKLDTPASLYAGTPAVRVKDLDPTSAWFTSGDEVIR